MKQSLISGIEYVPGYLDQQTCVMRFTQSDADGSREVLLEPRSVLVLSGEARWRWKHSIPSRVSDRWDGQEYVWSRRVSLTFRVIPDETCSVPSGAGIDVTIN